jgi:hypothetical protein
MTESKGSFPLRTERDTTSPVAGSDQAIEELVVPRSTPKGI